MSGIFEDTVTYGPGGFKPAQGDKNIMSTTQRQIPILENNERQLVTRSRAALATNATFLAIASPTAAQVAAQVKALTRQNNGLIRTLLRQFDDITDS